MTSRSLVGCYQHLDHTCCLHLQDRRDFHYSTLKMEAAGSSRIMITLYHTIWPHIPKNSNSHIHCRDTHKSHTKLGTLLNRFLGQLHNVHKMDLVHCTVSHILRPKRRQDSYPYPRTSYDTLNYSILSYVSKKKKKHFQCVAG